MNEQKNYLEEAKKYLADAHDEYAFEVNVTEANANALIAQVEVLTRIAVALEKLAGCVEPNLDSYTFNVNTGLEQP